MPLLLSAIAIRLKVVLFGLTREAQTGERLLGRVVPGAACSTCQPGACLARWWRPGSRPRLAGGADWVGGAAPDTQGSWPAATADVPTARVMSALPIRWGFTSVYALSDVCQEISVFMTVSGGLGHTDR